MPPNRELLSTTPLRWLRHLDPLPECSTCGPMCSSQNLVAHLRILWLNRELVFISMVLRLMASGKESGEAGYQAYEVPVLL